MVAERIFLGWDRPCLVGTVDFLLAKYRKEAVWDMETVVIAISGERAKRRLVELLADRAALPNGDSGRGIRPPLILIPPKIVTIGSLPEELATASTATATELHSVLARMQALSTADDLLLERIICHPPAKDDLPAWERLAEDLEKLNKEIAGEGLDFNDVIAACRQLGGHSDEERWTALRALDGRTVAQLAKDGFVTLHDARRTAREQQSYRTDREFVLLATADLPRATRAMLRETPATVTALIHAPTEESLGFDDLGCVDVDYWMDANISFPTASLKIVDRPRDQANAVLEAIEGLEARFAPDEMTVGLGDESLGPMLQRTLELSGRPARRAVARPVLLGRPALLLSAIADYLEDRRSDRFAALVRHPEVSDWLTRDLGDLRHGAKWLTALDKHLQDYLPRRLGAYWPPAAKNADLLEAVEQSVCRLLELLPSSRRSLQEWSAPIANLLAEVYGTPLLDPNIAEHAQIIHGITEIAQCLRSQRDVKFSCPLIQSFTASQAIRFTLNRLADEAQPGDGGEAAIELLGWLELPLDDAPVLIITDVNEGKVPQSINADAFLPDRLRRALGMTDNRRRYARDAFFLRAILASRPHVVLITGRVSAEHDPLSPSRLIFACDNEQLVERALAFYGTPNRQNSTLATRGLPPHGKNNTAAAFPKPTKLAARITKLPVTAFRDYLACPYRFYLKRILGLEGLDDSPNELDTLHFGSLLHDVLNAFGTSPIKGSSDECEIARYLASELNRLVMARFGEDRSPAVEIQAHQMQRRLDKFATFQAGHAAEGWRIQHVEVDATQTLDVNGEPFIVYGRLDRIDHHQNTGDYLILDYKSGDRRKSPEETHRNTEDGAKVWVDLQLPLYRRLAPSLNIDPRAVKLGYITLPKDLDQIGLAQATWDQEDLDTADRRVDQLITEIRAETFWPPSAGLPRYPDGLGAICLDTSIDRELLIRNIPSTEVIWNPRTIYGGGQ